jgi:hypothetical protein
VNGILSINDRTIFVWIGAVFLLIILFLGYADPFAIVMAYFIESIAIGLLNFLKMLLTSKERNKASKNSILFKCFFFLIHYSFFIFVQSVFVFAMFSMTDKNIKEPFNVFNNYSYAFTMEGFGLSMTVMVIILFLETFFTYIKPKTYKYLSAEDLFFKPYIRVLVQQFTVLFAIFLFLMLKMEVIVAAVLILLRLLVDLTGIYITASDANLYRFSKFIKKNHKRSDIEAIEELKKFL